MLILGNFESIPWSFRNQQHVVTFYSVQYEYSGGDDDDNDDDDDQSINQSIPCFTISVLYSCSLLPHCISDSCCFLANSWCLPCLPYVYFVACTMYVGGTRSSTDSQDLTLAPSISRIVYPKSGSPIVISCCFSFLFPLLCSISRPWSISKTSVGSRACGNSLVITPGHGSGRRGCEQRAPILWHLMCSFTF